jgi:hypothetical protein
MSHYVNAQPIGRLGNQMFQVSAALGYAKKFGLQWGFPSDTREVPNLRKFFPNIPVLDGQFKRLNWADPAFFNYQPIPNLHRDTTLVGFYQSEKYFEGQQEEVRKLFKLNIQPEYKDYVSIHVRRGDYVQHANSFPPVTDDYLIKAFNFFCPLKTKFIFFSDDIRWCVDFTKKWFSAFDDVDFIFSEGRNEFEDLSLMASCSHNIIANSTFSWWGAWLNPNPDKIVVSPSMYNWFGPGFTGSVPKDIIPPEWHQIKF